MSVNDSAVSQRRLGGGHHHPAAGRVAKTRALQGAGLVEDRGPPVG